MKVIIDLETDDNITIICRCDYMYYRIILCFNCWPASCRSI